jgi:ribonuclease Z
LNVDVSFNTAEAAGSPEPSPVKAMLDRDAYFPTTEVFGPNEMRIISLGTAMPFSRPAQAAPSFLVEQGNGDKFLFDIGTGSRRRRRKS